MPFASPTITWVIIPPLSTNIPIWRYISEEISVRYLASSGLTISLCIFLRYTLSRESR
ncbi:MAG: hypothetical protein ACPL1G_02030 [Thermodesulfovibrionales bacterium]